MGIKVKDITFKAIDALSFKISGYTEGIKEYKEGKQIKELKGPDGLHLSLGLAVEVDRNWYIINSIKVDNRFKNTTYILSMADRTKSSTFLMPMIGGDRSLYFWESLFVNCHLYIEEDVYHMALVYRYSSDPLFLKFEQTVRKFESFVKILDPDPHYVVFILNVPKKQARNFQKFMKGKYSKLSARYKDAIEDFHNFSPTGTIMQVVHKLAPRKKLLEGLLGCTLEDDSELMSIINLEKEILNMEKYIKKTKTIR
jgi:hypothetical protein|tara:strand:- start:14029 stop:14793 length:765 start_codon:yes stop_codon:yes gene_type:complete